MIDILRELVGPQVIPAILESGYNFDFFDDDSLSKVGTVEKDSLRLGANRYRVVLLPGVVRIPVDTLRKLEQFVRGGGVLIATRRVPELAPGLQATESEQKEVREITARLFAGQSSRSRLVKDESSELGRTLVSLLPPDVQLTPAVPQIGFIHRRTNDAEIYFVANTSNESRIVAATFRVAGMQPEWWDPLTGKVVATEVTTRAQGTTTIRLDLAPYASRVLVFSKRSLELPNSGRANGTTSEIDLSKGWQVTFAGQTKSTQMDQLRSWTDDEETRYFSGLATYEKEIDVNESMLGAGTIVNLDFGEGQALPEQPLRAGMQTWFDAPVREAAVVYVNDQRVGSVWCPPYSLELTGRLRTGKNRLRIVVGNLALNYMAGHRLPDYRLLNLRYGERFQAQDMDKVKPVVSGLVGKIRLLTSEKR